MRRSASTALERGNSLNALLLIGSIRFGRPGHYALARNAKMPKRRMRTASAKPTLLRSPPLRKPKNTDAPASAPTKSHVAVKYHLGDASGRNMLAARTTAAAMPYASDLQISKEVVTAPNYIISSPIMHGFVHD
jgi:hypothetical protein